MRQLLERSATAVAFTIQCTAYVTRCSVALIKLHAFLSVAAFRTPDAVKPLPAVHVSWQPPQPNPVLGCPVQLTLPRPFLLWCVLLSYLATLFLTVPKCVVSMPMTASSTQNWQTVKDSALPMSAASVPQHCLHVSDVFKVTCNMYKAPD